MSQAQDSDALPVPAEEVAIAEPVRAELVPQQRARPAVQAAVAAAGGFVAGAAVVGLVSRHRSAGALAGPRRARSLRGQRPSPGTEILQVVGSRTLLLDVHLLGSPGHEH